MKGGKRKGAGRKPSSEKKVMLSVKLTPDLMECLSDWQTLGYASKSAAIKDAIVLWRTFQDIGLWRFQAECFDLLCRPKRRIIEYVTEIQQTKQEDKQEFFA